MMNPAIRVPLRADFSAARSRNDATLFRAATALLQCQVEQKPLKTILRERWSHDRNIELTVKAATAPQTMTNTDWSSMQVADVATIFSAASAARTLLPLGLQFTFDKTALIIAPYGTGDATAATFIAESAAIPVRQYALSAGPQLTPKKLASISVFSREVFLHSLPSAEQTVRTKVSEDLGLACDKYLFDAVAADVIRPSGLRFNINTSTASVSGVRAEAMAADIATLVTATASVAGNMPVIFVASPAQAAALRLWNNPRFDYAAGYVVCIATNCLMSAAAAAPRFELVSEATLHLEDTTPLDITTTAVGQTVKSLFQSDLVALRTVLEINWCLRVPAGLAWMSGVA